MQCFPLYCLLQAEKVVAESLACMTEPSEAGCKSVVTKFQQANYNYPFSFTFGLFHSTPSTCWHYVYLLFSFFQLYSFQCPLLNISYCPSSEVDLSQGKDLVRDSLMMTFSAIFSDKKKNCHVLLLIKKIINFVMYSLCRLLLSTILWDGKERMW